MARVIPNLDPWADVWEKTGAAIGTGLMTGWEKGKQQKEMEELGLDFSTPESTIDSMRKLGGYYLDKGQTEDGINMLSKALAAQATFARGTAPAKERDVQPLGEKQRESIESMIDKEFQTGWFDFMDAEIPGGFDKAGLADVIHYYSQSGQVQKSPAQVIKELKEGTLSINDLLKSGTMQQPSGGGSALTGTAPPVPSIFKR